MKRVINGKTYSKVLGIKQGSLLTAGKDGDIEEYKADPNDAGKVLTVGEDGSVAPAEGGGGGKKYLHQIYTPLTGPVGYLYYINESETPFSTIGGVLTEIFANKSVNYRYPVYGTGWSSSGYNYVATYLWKQSDSNARVGGFSGQQNHDMTETDFIGNLPLSSNNPVVDYVTEI